MKKSNQLLDKSFKKHSGVNMSSSRFSLLAGLFFICSFASADESLRNVEKRIESPPLDNKGSLHLEVEQVSLERVFTIIEAQTGVKLHTSMMPSKRVSATCAGTTLEVLKCLLGKKVNLIYRYSDNSSAGSSAHLLTDVWVLNPDPGERREAKGTRICNTAQNLHDAIQERQKGFSKGHLAALTLDKIETEKLLKMAQSTNPKERRQALSRLVFADQAYNHEVREMLQDALQDPNARVRAQAVSALARRNGPDIESVLKEALHDSAVGVRLMAVSHAGENIYLLKSALGDPKRVVRHLARLKLDRTLETHSD